MSCARARRAGAELADRSVLVVACAQRAGSGRSATTRSRWRRSTRTAVRALAADRRRPGRGAARASGGVPRRVHELASRWARARGGAPRRRGGRASRRGPRRAALASRPSWRATSSSCRPPGERRRAGRAATAPVVCPFKGLASFDVADAPYFFGRERLVAELVARLVGAPLLGVVGPSGSGKSSVVRAGLLPALAGGRAAGQRGLGAGRASARASIRCASSPHATARRAATAVAWCSPSTSSRRRSRSAATSASARAFVAALVARRRRAATSSCSRCAPTTTAAAPPTRSCRAGSRRHHVLVGADAPRRAAPRVERPAQRAGLRVEPELTDALVADVERRAGRAAAALDRAARALAAARRAPAAAVDLRGQPAASAARSRGSPRTRSAALDAAQRALARGVLLRLATEDAGGAVERRRVPLDRARRRRRRASSPCSPTSAC